jgi:hypothetical protein
MAPTVGSLACPLCGAPLEGAAHSWQPVNRAWGRAVVFYCAREQAADEEAAA